MPTHDQVRIRTLTDKEMPMAARLWKYSFADNDAFIDWYFRRRAGEVLAALDGDELVAQIVCAPLPVSMRGAAREAVMLAGIATAPVYRRRGHINALMAEAFRRLQEEGVCAATLYPFDYTYYARYGFAPCGLVANVRAGLSRLPGARPTGRLQMLKGDAGDAGLLVRAYEACYSHYSGHALRDEAAFALLLEENALDDGCALVYYHEDRLEGYLLYAIQDNAVAVSEIGAASQAARVDLLSFIGSHSSSVGDVAFLCPLDDLLWQCLPDPRGAVSAEPHDMLRLIDVGSAMHGLPAGQGEVCLRVTDSYAPWNDGVWRFRALDGALVAEKLDGGANAAVAMQAETAASTKAAAHAESAADAIEPDAELSIGALTQWAFGCMDGSALADAGAGLTAEVAQAMDALLPRQPFFLFEKY